MILFLRMKASIEITDQMRSSILNNSTWLRQKSKPSEWNSREIIIILGSKSKLLQFCDTNSHCDKDLGVNTESIWVYIKNDFIRLKISVWNIFKTIQ